jgi:hypothetical protein
MELINNNTLRENAMIELTDYLVSNVNGKKVLLIMDVTVLEQRDESIGQPTNIEDGGAATLPAQVVSKAAAPVKKASKSGVARNYVDIDVITPYSGSNFNIKARVSR